MGIVEEVGSQVSTIKRGDRVTPPFAFSDATCLSGDTPIEVAIWGAYQELEHKYGESMQTYEW